MSGALISTVSDALKYRYLGRMKSQLNNEILITQILELDSKRIDLDGLSAVVPLHYGRSTGVGARREDEDLPAAGNQKYKKANYDLAYLYGRARFTGPAIQKTKSDAGSFIRVMTDELERLRNDLKLDTARQYYGSTVGVQGAIAKVASVSSLDITLTSDEALQKGFIHVGMRLDFGSANTASTDAADSVTVTDIDVASKVVTLDSAGTIAANDYAFREDTADASGTKEIDAGLQTLISTAANTVGGIDGSAAGLKFWQNLTDSSGTNSLDQFQLNWNKVSASGVVASDVVTLTTPGIVRRLFATDDFKANVRFMESEELKGGFEQISFATGAGRMRLTTDRLAPYGKVHFVDKSAIKVYSPGDWDFISKDGMTVRWVDNRDAFQAALFMYANLGTDRRNTSLVMSGLTDTGF